MEQRFQFQGRIKRISFLCVSIGVVSLAIGYAFYPENHHQRFWGSLLLNNFYFFGLAIGATFFLAVQYASNAGWSVLIKRVPEAIGAFLPVSALFMGGMFFFGLHSLYHWTHLPQDAVIQEKAGYLNETFFWIRFVVFFGLWISFWASLRRASVEEDANQCSVGKYKKTRRNAYIFLVVFALTITLASFDWLMSLDPHWFSTMFGIYCFSGIFCKGVGAVIVVTYLLHRGGHLKGVNESHFHSLGQYLFAFSTFWCYIWFFQFMLIWYANMPEETRWYESQLESGLFYVNPLVNWAIPFFGLISQKAKKNMRILIPITVVSLLGYFLDLFLVITPILNTEWHFGLFEIGSYVGFLGCFALLVGRSLGRVALVPQQHPLLKESLSYHQ